MSGNCVSTAFDVNVIPQGTPDSAEGIALGRLSLARQFHGDLEETSKGEMLTSGQESDGRGGARFGDRSIRRTYRHHDHHHHRQETPLRVLIFAAGAIDVAPRGTRTRTETQGELMNHAAVQADRSGPVVSDWRWLTMRSPRMSAGD